MSTTARLFIDPQPEMGGTRYTVDCKHGTTRLWWCPGGDLKLTESQLITVLLQRHEDECGRCNLTRLWEQHGDQELMALTDRVWDQVQTQRVAEHLAGRRN